MKLWLKTAAPTKLANMSIPMAVLLRHVSALLYQFIIVSVSLIPCTLNVRHSAFVLASAVSVAAASSSLPSSAAAAENNYELHAAHISIDSLRRAVDNNNNNDLSQLIFEPNFLHFDELSVGETANKVVRIFNRHANRSVYLGSISGSVSDFYSSFFEENLVPPMGNTTFNVVFLPRQQAIIQAHLIIHTSFGVLNYEVKGKGVECPYRLSPLVGMVAPLNATLMPEIHMYNPYDTPLQIVEVYSSGGQFQLELPTGDGESADAVSAANSAAQNAERSQTLWEIPPHCSRPVIRVRFTATHVGNSTAYIRIKVSARKNAALEKAVIVLPIEVEIFKDHGIYSSLPFINFGLSGTNDRPKSVTFRLLNSGEEPFEVTSYSVEAEENVRNGITLELNTARDAVNHSTMTATVNWSRISAEQFFRGHIIVQTRRKGSSDATTTKSKRSQYRVPFVGGILRGSIQYNASLTRFHQAGAAALDDKAVKTPIVRDFRIKNNFDVVLAITNLTMSPDTMLYFRADQFKSRFLAPGEESTIFRIVQQPAAAMHSVTRSFHLHTNVSVYDIELFSFNGLLKRVLPVTDTADMIVVDEKSINFGILPLSTMSQIQLALVNHNPIPINIHNWKGTISSAAHVGITVPGCSKLTMKGLKFCNIVKPGEWIVFQIGVTSNTVGSFDGKFTVQTDYEVISTPIRFSTDMGILKFTTKVIDSQNCFPGGVCNVNLTAFSSFTRSMHIKTVQANNICLENASKIESSADDTDGYDECHVTNLSRAVKGKSSVRSPNVMYEDGDKPVISAQSESYIDQLEVSIPKICDERCALNSAQIGAMAEANKQRFSLLKKQLERFRTLSAKFQKLTFHIQTNHIKRYDFNVSIDIVWPKLVNGPIEFAISQVGQELVKHIDIYNPFNDPLQIDCQIHDVERLGSELPADIIDDCPDAILTVDPVFSIDDHKKQSEMITIPPKTYHQITVNFMSENAGTYGTLLYIRNNVTVVEGVWLTAKSVVPQFKFGNRKPGSKTPLLFELTDKHLRDCNHPNVNMRSVTAKRTFTAKNNGEVPIYMRELRIDDMPCEGYGYRVLECGPFELPPNGSRKIEISFTPDFTLAMVKKTLYLETSLNYSVNYTLLSMIAPLSLGVCSKALARPEWESVMKNVTAVVLAVSFVCVLCAAYLDSMKVLKVHLENMSKAKGSLQPALDLRQIGLKSLFMDEASKNATAATPTAQNATAVKSSGQSTPVACNAKANGNIFKKNKSAEKKRTSCTEIIAPKKSYITEIAKKFTPKKADKAKSEQIKPKSSPTSATTAATTKKDKRSKEDSPSANFEEEETSSTTTESSSHSDDKLPNVKAKLKKSSQTKDLANALPQKDKKSMVKKSKSLPLSYESPECTLSAPSADDKSHDVDEQKDSCGASIASGSSSDDSFKCPNTSDMFTMGTPPSKPDVLKLMNGKTPGRERNRATDNVPSRKSFETNQVTFKSAFEFSSPLAELPISGSHPLLDLVDKSLYEHQYCQDNGDKSKPSTASVSMSSMLKQQTTKANGKAAKASSTRPKTDVKTKERKNTKKYASSDDGNGTLASFDNMSDSSRKVAAPTVDLGPIGTRKSPSSTPIWEPMHSIHNPTPITSNPLNSLAGDSNSFFSGAYPQTSTFQYTENPLNKLLNQQNPQMNAPEQLLNLHQQLQIWNSVYGNGSLDQPKQNLWDSALILNLLRHQQQQQQQQQLEQQRLQNAYSSAQSSLWNSGNVFDTAQATPSTSYWSSALPSASNAHEVRPPPGFNTAARDSRALQHDLFLRHYQQQQIQNQQLQAQQQQQQQQQQNQTAQPDANQYNLFNSIWSTDNSWNNQNTDHNKKTK